MKNGWRIPCNVTASCEMLRINFLIGWQTLFEWRFGILINGPLIPFGYERLFGLSNGQVTLGAMEYHPTSAKDIAITSIWSTDLPVFSRVCIVRGMNLERRHYDNEELEEIDECDIQTRRLNAKEVLTPNERWHLHL